MNARSIVLMTAPVATLLVLAGGIYTFDATRGDNVPKGVTVAAVDISVVSQAAAGSKLEAEFVDQLREPIKVNWDRATWVLGAREARVEADLDTIMADVARLKDRGNLLTRTWRRATGGS